MGLRFRKSYNLGCGFRINISKHGVGYSWGVPGYRISKSASGQTRKTYSIPGTGISYVEQRKNKNASIKPKSNTYTDSDLVENLDVSDLSKLQSAEFADLTKSMHYFIVLSKIFGILSVAIIFLFSGDFGLALIGLIGIAGKIYISHTKRPYLDYEMDEDALERYNNILSAISNLKTCKKIWHITEAQAVNAKTNAGASHNVKRSPFKIYTKAPYFFTSNIDTAYMKFASKIVVFLPDKIIIVKGTKVGMASYMDLNIIQSYTPFIESDKVPSDAEVLRYTWKYVNRDGGPDKRFKNNRQYPVCKYGDLIISEGNNLYIRMMCSNYEKSEIFSEDFLTRCKSQN